MGEEFKPLRQFFPGLEMDDVVYGGYLPDVIIKPTTNTKSALNKLKLIIPDKKLRQQVMNTRYGKQDEYSTIDKLYRVWKRAGKPAIKSFENLGIFGKMIIQPIMNIRTNGRNRANYHPFTNEMVVGSYGDLMEEIPHAYLYYNENVPVGGLFNTGFGLPGDISINGRDGYKRYTNPEFMAHTIIEPYLDGYINEDATGYTLDDVDYYITDMYQNPEEYGIHRNYTPKKTKPSYILGNTIPMLKR